MITGHPQQCNEGRASETFPSKACLLRPRLHETETSGCEPHNEEPRNGRFAAGETRSPQATTATVRGLPIDSSSPAASSNPPSAQLASRNGSVVHLCWLRSTSCESKRLVTPSSLYDHIPGSARLHDARRMAERWKFRCAVLECSWNVGHQNGDLLSEPRTRHRTRRPLQRPTDYVVGPAAT